LSAVADVPREQPAPTVAARGNFVRAALMTFAVSGAGLACNLLTGVLIARVLGPEGRGALAAAFAAPPILSWLFEMGCASAATYHLARHPADAGRLVATWLVIFVPLMLVGIGVGETALPHLLAAQSAHTLFLARLVMLTLVTVLLSDLMYGVVLGDQDFTFYNLARLGQPLGVGISYVVLWLVGELTVTTAVVATALTGVAVAAVVGGRVLRRHGLGRPSLRVARSTLWYGLRAHSTMTAGLVNMRLDVLIIPAFLGASSVGLYSVATNVSWIVVTVSGSLSALVFPAATAQGARGGETVVKSLYATLAVGLLIAGTLAAVSGSVEPMRILLLGSVLYAAAGAPCAGLYALNRPFTAGVAQLLAAVVTVTGLLLFLQHGGIRAAAIVSTVAYGLVFALALVLYRRAAQLRWRDLVLTPSLMRLWARQAARAALGRA
jgi:O-antigen/teichoic acid export membrane protein